jgi:sialic acid synthase SpsE
MKKNINKVLIIAEIGPNHNGSYLRAKKMIEQLSKTGADAVKFQFGNPNDVYSDNSIMANYQKKNDNSKSIIQMSVKNQLSLEEHIKLFRICIKKKILYACSVFDLKSLILLNKKINLPFFKIPSGEINSVDILDYISEKNKKIFLSTGMASFKEIKQAVIKLKSKGNNKITVMHCISAYPAKDNMVNMEFLETLKKLNCNIGYSDHTLNDLACIAAISKGARVIEKHVTTSKNQIGPDHKSSYTIKEFGEFVKKIRKLEIILGKNLKIFSKEELNVKKVARKSIVALNNIHKGKKIKSSDLVFKRPGTGISPKDMKFVLGKKAKFLIKKNTLIKKSGIK